MSLHAAASPAPEISLSLRGVGDGIVEQGEPLRVVVRLRAPRGTKETILLAPLTGTWTDAIRVEISPVSGGAVAAHGEVVGKPDTARAELDVARDTGGLWRFSSEVMQQLAPGNYAVRSRLQIAGGSGWTGEIVSAPARLQVVAASDAADRKVQRAVNRAHDALLRGQVEEAAKILDVVLTSSPDDRRLLTARAVVAERAGNIVAALLCVNRAERARLLASIGPPNLEIQELQAQLQQALPAAMKRTEKPAEWSWPPQNVMTLSEADLVKASLSASVPVTPTNSRTTALPTTPPGVATVIPPSTRSGTDAMKPKATGSVSPADDKLGAASELGGAKIQTDTNGQWAISARASSEYRATNYGAMQATDAPNVAKHGDNGRAWAAKAADLGEEWLELTFARAVRATGVRVVQSFNPGAVVRIEVIDAANVATVVWRGPDATGYAKNEVGVLDVIFPVTAVPVARVKIVLNEKAVAGWNEIDAVQLVGADAN